jgi:hypothetical protein
MKVESQYHVIHELSHRSDPLGKLVARNLSLSQHTKGSMVRLLVVRGLIYEMPNLAELLGVLPTWMPRLIRQCSAKVSTGLRHSKHDDQYRCSIECNISDRPSVLFLQGLIFSCNATIEKVDGPLCVAFPTERLAISGSLTYFQTNTLGLC